MDAAVAPDLLSGLVDDCAPPERLGRRLPLDEAGRAARGHEADLHAVRLLGDREAERPSLGPHLGLGQLADREERPLQVRAGEREQEVGLVLGGVGRGPEAWAAALGVDADAGIVAGGKPARAELPGSPPEQAELDVLVAARARVRRAPGEVLGDERPHHLALEDVGEVEHVVGKAEPVGDRARVVEVVEGAAAAASVARQAERDADHLMARADAPGGRDRAVDTAAHRDHDPHAAAPRRTWATSSGSTASTWSMPASVVAGPTLRRSPLRAVSGSLPMATRTCDGSAAPAAHAEPADTAMPARSRSTTRLSPLQPGKVRFSVFGSRGGAAGPLSCTPGTRARSPDQRRSTSRAQRAPATARSRPASRAASPKPTMPATFSVPARRLRSCGPPVIWGRRPTSRRTQSAPTPAGPPSLWAESESRSTPSARTSIGIRPAACAASVWRSTPLPRSPPAIAATGATEPTSPFASPTLASAVPGAHAATTSSAATRPSPSTGTTVSRTPSAASARAVSSTEACSIAVVTRPAGARTTPRNARLFASVAPLVNTISAGPAPMSAATSARAASTAPRARAPSRCALDGFPGLPRQRSMASRASGRSGAPALWSR